MFRSLNKFLSSPNKNLFFSSFSNNMSQFVRVNAFDHDGCIGLPGMELNEIDLMHRPLIEHLNEQKKINGYTADYVTVNSNRQSIRLDCLNSICNKNNLAFPVAKRLAKALGACFDPFLLADISANRKPGFTVNCIQEVASEKNLNLSEESVSREVLDALLQGNYADFAFSEDKINIVYPRMHRAALFHPQAIIDLNVYDDLSEQVLVPLERFYSLYPILIPENVKLNLYYFNTLNLDLNPPELIYSIKGTGPIDKKYYQTVTKMEEIAKSEEGIIGKYRMGQYITLKLIQKDFCLSNACRPPSL